jgi:hypothetical protein
VKRKPVVFSEPRLLTASELAKRAFTDPACPSSYVWVVETKHANFTDETAEGALALAKQFHKGH